VFAREASAGFHRATFSALRQDDIR